MKQSNIYLASKPRYEILDGLRGVAALLVVAYHLFETYFGGSPAQPINHGYLAVDFFFVLSGFVIGYAYDDRWDRMSTWNFFKRRLVRLHPMVIFGTMVGTLLFYFGDCSAFPLVRETSPFVLLAVMLIGFTMLPIGTGLDIRGWGETNPLNGPAWSLQWEYLANILYALFIRRLGKVALGICVVVFAGFTVALTLNIDVFGFLAVRDYASYTVIGGWSLTPDQLQIGATRLLYPFFSGLLLSRMGWLIKVKGGFWWCSLMIVVILGMPWMGTSVEGAGRWTNGLYEMLCILLGFPLIVSIGAGSSVIGGKSAVISKFLGDISYPIYIIHFPLIYMHIAWVRNHPEATLSQNIMISVSVFVTSILLAYGAHRLYDIPVREWLKNKLFSH